MHAYESGIYARMSCECRGNNWGESERAPHVREVQHTYRYTAYKFLKSCAHHVTLRPTEVCRHVFMPDATCIPAKKVDWSIVLHRGFVQEFGQEMGAQTPALCVFLMSLLLLTIQEERVFTPSKLCAHV